MIELPIHPPFDYSLDVAEIGHHVARIQRVGLYLDFGNGVVSVRMLAHTVVVEQPMAVTELNLLGDRVHSL